MTTGPGDQVPAAGPPAAGTPAAGHPPAGHPPTGPRAFTRAARTRAPVEEVWPLLGEARRWQEWSFLDRTELITEGRPDPDGVGAVRKFTRYGVGSTEEVVAWEPPTHLAYTILTGFPVRDYRADVVLVPATGAGNEGTTVTWSVTFEPRYPWAGGLTELVLRRLIQRFVTSVCRYADRQRAATGRP